MRADILTLNIYIPILKVAPKGWGTIFYYTTTKQRHKELLKILYQD